MTIEELASLIRRCRCSGIEDYLVAEGQLFSAWADKDKEIAYLTEWKKAAKISAVNQDKVVEIMRIDIEARDKQIADLKAENESLKCCWNCKYIYTRNCDRWMDAKGSEMYTRYEKCEKWEKR